MTLLLTLSVSKCTCDDAPAKSLAVKNSGSNQCCNSLFLLMPVTSLLTPATEKRTFCSRVCDLPATQLRDLLGVEILDDRHGLCSNLVTSQLSTRKRHECLAIPPWLVLSWIACPTTRAERICREIPCANRKHR